ncbi:MAG: hypothetical protein IKQ93_09095 [Candidatus Methanomethylophilaceae archaeon]|nr:hypothetical protein [Candidatus Methanomethylophilaceae archaeon]
MPGDIKKSKPVQKPTSAPAGKPAPKPAAKPAAKPVSKPAVGKPAPKIQSKPTPQSNQYLGDKQGAKKNKPVRTKESTKKQSMLNTHKLAPFKYDMNEILSASRMDPAKASSFLASVIAKASRISTKEAKEFAKTFLEADDLTKEEYDKICKLLDRYSKFR